MAALDLSPRWPLLLAGRLAAAALGLLWLGLITQRLPAPQLGLYFGLMALFEVVQHLASLGVNTYAERFVPADACRMGAGLLRRRVRGLLLWRALPLLGVAACTPWLLPLLATRLQWPTSALPPAWLWSAFLVAEGLFRFAELLLQALLRAGTVQWLLLGRSTGRLGLFWTLGEGLLHGSATMVLMADTVATGLALVLAAGQLAWLLAHGSTPACAPSPDGSARGARAGFALRGYAALAIERVAGIDMIKLLLSHLSGPAALATFGLAWALIDLVNRYMPLMLLHGPLRAWLTVQHEQGSPLRGLTERVAALLRLNARVVVLALPLLWLAVPVLLQRLGSDVDAQGLRVCLMALLAVPALQALRVALGMVAHVRRDGRRLLRASLVMPLVPAGVAALAAWHPAWGGVVAALGCLANEALPSAVLAWRTGLLPALLGGAARFWRMLATAAVLAMGVAWRLPPVASLNDAWPLLAALLLVAGLAAVWRGPLRQSLRHDLLALRPASAA